MILLADDCLVFHTASGEGVPYSAEMISVELMGDTASLFDPEFIKHAAAAVFHYFRDELGCQTVTIAEFSLALERVLRGFNLAASRKDSDPPVPRVVQSDLCRLVTESGKGCELFFFPRLRDEMQVTGMEEIEAAIGEADAEAAPPPQRRAFRGRFAHRDFAFGRAHFVVGHGPYDSRSVRRSPEDVTLFHRSAANGARCSSLGVFGPQNGGARDGSRSNPMA